jgi:hypothetical protein
MVQATRKEVPRETRVSELYEYSCSCFDGGRTSTVLYGTIDIGWEIAWRFMGGLGGGDMTYSISCGWIAELKKTVDVRFDACHGSCSTSANSKFIKDPDLVRGCGSTQKKVKKKRESPGI